jgi:hypothetical protein
VYADLKKRGLNVFFSYVTLKNEVRSDDLIWLNLVKSKKMLLIGSREEYLESAWVKSEWQRWRFLGRSEELYICVLNEGEDSPKKILPYELRKDAPQIYTQDTYKKMIAELCETEYTEEVPAHTQAPSPAKPPVTATQPVQATPPAQVTNPAQVTKHSETRTVKYDGQIVYTSGDVKILEYGCKKIISADDQRKNIVSVTLPNSITSIEANAFDSCSSLRNVLIPDSVTRIGSNAFRGCTSMISINIPENKIELKVDEAIIAERMKNFTPKTKELTGYLKRYAKLVSGGAYGAILD